MLNVGLTGGIGMGKSEVARRFAARGATIIDADALAREVVEIGTPALAAIVVAFGPQVLAVDGSMDRAKVARIVFVDDEARLRLNRIVHPAIRVRTEALTAKAQAANPSGVLMHDIPLIVETGSEDRFDVIVVVDAPIETQLERLTRDRGMTAAEARARVATQASREDRRAIADWVIDNSGDRDALDPQVELVWAELVARAASPVA